MREITLPKYGKFIVKTDGTVYDTEAARAEFRQYWQNVREVIISTAMVEDALRGIVTMYFVSEDQKRVQFQNLMTNTSAFSFNESRRVATAILREKGVDEPKLKDLDELLRKVMDYRNQLVHGSPAIVHDKFILSFFKGKAELIEINEDYWKKLNERFWECHTLLDTIIPKA
jgi:hypothetical protein